MSSTQPPECEDTLAFMSRQYENVLDFVKFCLGEATAGARNEGGGADMLRLLQRWKMQM